MSVVIPCTAGATLTGRDATEFSKHRVGFALVHRAIQAGAFDFLHGREDYKYRWPTTEGVNLQLVFCTSRSAKLAHELADFDKLRREDWSSRFRRGTSW